MSNVLEEHGLLPFKPLVDAAIDVARAKEETSESIENKKILLLVAEKIFESPASNKPVELKCRSK